MINAIIGDIVSVTETSVVLRCNDIEYNLNVSAQTSSRLSNLKGEERVGVRLLTTLVHREDSMTLFAFIDEAEREAFKQLQTVSGIGSKQALKILSGISVKHLAEALDSGNVKLLSTIPGIGPKTGQKMILTLRNVLVLEDEKMPASASSKRTSLKMWGDILDALVEMGYDRRRVEDVVEKLVTEEKEKLSALSHHETEEYLFRSAIVALG
ncbi:Holliday junction branch migration protein RuvA [Sphaerochaeta sp. PS]|uniref:Holliday junction branch migration protein RuvA n=1 Tax=Sphaerochaeta sp. PS TaxID=3076336 RepID=UPI0028A2E987|nr:Holliday junction branch migration protein RuvA [Sphaerochaeta sp. PS]MDT4761492.1 Holliday junction branch migration protein RuvA [Sphaerochaeta sp. PS]